MIGDKVLIREVALGLALVGLLGVGLLWIFRESTSRPPDMNGVDRLLAEQRFAEVEERLQKILSKRPDDPQANMLMAQVSLARIDQKPELALRHLDRVQLRGTAARALVQLNRGKAYSALGRYVDAEQSWTEALSIDPLVPEAGWALLGLYYIQGRRDDAHRLAMNLRAIEPDPRDRAQLLLELLRQDAKSLVQETLIPILRPVVQNHPDDKYSAIALARALTSSSQPAESLLILHRLIERFPGDLLCWEALLSGLDDSFRYDELEQALNRMPPSLSADCRFEKFRGSLAQSKRQWTEAIRAYRRSVTAAPFDKRVLYRLCQSLRASGHEQEAETIEPRRRRIDSAHEDALRLYEEANSITSLGTAPHPDLYHRLADLRERMGCSDEAMAWHQLVLLDQPHDLVSRTALERLSEQEPEIQSHP
jgi:tetratricopeptide (TPR) repeat protein